MPNRFWIQIQKNPRWPLKLNSNAITQLLLYTLSWNLMWELRSPAYSSQIVNSKWRSHGGSCQKFSRLKFLLDPKPQDWLISSKRKLLRQVCWKICSLDIYFNTFLLSYVVLKVQCIVVVRSSVRNSPVVLFKDVDKNRGSLK